MKISKKLLLVMLFLLMVTGLIGCTGDENSFDNDDSETIKLNLHSADLIADITDNEKYLNKNLLYNVKTLDDIKKLDEEFKKKSDDKKQVFKNTKSSEPTVKTRFHNINQTFAKYTPEELEKMLQENQKNKFK